MATSWTLLVAAPLAQVTASVEPLASKPALSALGDEATLARFESDAVNPGALSFELRGLLGAIVDAVGQEGLRALDATDGVTDLASARAAPGTWVSAPAVMSFADMAAAFGPPATAADDATTIRNADDLSARLNSAFKAREDPALLEKRLRASRGMAEWGAVFGVAPEAPSADAKDVVDATVDKDKLRDELKETLREVQVDAIPEAADDTTFQKSEGRRELEEVLRGGGESAGAGEGEKSAPPEGGVGQA